MNASTKKVSASGYDITPIPTAERDQLAARLTPEERHVLFEHGTQALTLAAKSVRPAGAAKDWWRRRRSR